MLRSVLLILSVKGLAIVDSSSNQVYSKKFFYVNCGGKLRMFQFPFGGTKLLRLVSLFVMPV